MSNFLQSGIRVSNYWLDDDRVNDLRNLWRNFSSTVNDYKDSFDGNGIVFCAGGISYFTCVWVSINSLRNLGCRLPIEVWYLRGELSDEVKHRLEDLGVDCRDFFDEADTEIRGVCLKPLAILLSKFRNVMFLDADNNCLRDPSYLFSSMEFSEYGALFWPDYWKTSADNPIWRIIAKDCLDEFEQESGQILIDKQRCWKPLNLALYFNICKEVYHKLLFGDKDTFRFAWRALDYRFYMIETEVACCGRFVGDRFVGNTMIQHDLHGNSLFLHRNLQKWDTLNSLSLGNWRYVKSFSKSAKEKMYHASYDVKLKQYTMDISGDINLCLSTDDVLTLEKKSIDILIKLKNAPFYRSFVIQSSLNLRLKMRQNRTLQE